MVYQIPNNVIDIKVCSISFQRHCHNVLSSRNKDNSKLYKKSNMADNLERQALPVVELRPFSKKVWRREKSLPDFYDKKKSDDPNSSSNLNGLEVTPSSSRAVNDFTEARKCLESRQNTFDSASGKYRNHPKAEFLHESNRTWRKQDFIPSFITRFERTKTSLECLSRENTLHKMCLDQTSIIDNALKREPNPTITVHGGRMNQQIHRRHLVYLNPLETYRQPNSWVPHFNSSNPSRQNTSRDKYFSNTNNRHNFPMMSSKTRDLILGDTHAHYPLRPIRREDAESPHIFNTKLGAAKNSLEVLSKIGIQTRLEKALEKEMELNLDKCRKDRLLLASDLKGGHFNYVNFESNLTVGEQALRNAREANKKAKDKQRQGHARKTMTSIDNGVGSPRLLDTSVVNPFLHPVGQMLAEETDMRASSKGGNMSGMERIDNEKKSIHLLDKTQRVGKDCVEHSAPKELKSSSSNLIDSNKGEFHSQEKDSLISAKSNSGTTEINNNDIMTRGKIIDSSRIETNVAYLENLQLKTTFVDLSTGSTTVSPITPGLSRKEAHLGITSNEEQLGLYDTPTEAQLGDNNTSEKAQLGIKFASEEAQLVSKVASNEEPQIQPSSSRLNGPRDQEPSSQTQTNKSPQSTLSFTQNQPNQLPPLSPHGEITSQQTPTISQVSNATLVTNETMPLSQATAIPSLLPNPQAVDTVAGTNEPVHVDSSREKHDKPSDDVTVEDTCKSGVESINPSPLTSSGIESQVTTDQEDDLSPSSDDQSMTRDKTDTGHSPDHKHKNLSEDVNADKTAHDLISRSQDLPTSDSDSNHRVGEEGKPVEMNPKKYAIQDSINKDIPHLKDQMRSLSPKTGKRLTNYSPLDDEGISLAPTESVVLDSSVTEIYSDLEGQTGCVDNGDSGISTTFLTSGSVEGIVLS